MKQQSPKDLALKDLQRIPGVGKSVANDLWNIGITSVAELRERNPEQLYDESNQFAGMEQDYCLVYVFRCAVYFASNQVHDPEKLKWWNWKDPVPHKRSKKNNHENTLQLDQR